MARLYNGFNALALGQAINNTNNDIHNRRMTGLQMLGSSLQDLARAHKEEEEKQAQKQSALDFLTGNGMSQESAQAMVNSGIAPGELTMYMRGQLDKKADTADQRAYEEKMYGIKRADSVADQKAGFEHAEKMFDKSSKQNTLISSLGQIFGLLGSINAKDWGNSIKGEERYRDALEALNELAAQNPELAPLAKMVANNSPFAKGPSEVDLDTDRGLENELNDLDSMLYGGTYDEDIQDYMKYHKDDSDEQKNNYFKYLQDNNKFSYMLSRPDLFGDVLAGYTANADNKKLSKHLLLQKAIGSNTTLPQRDREIKKKNYDKMVANAKKKIENYANNRVNADFSDEEIKALWEEPRYREVLLRKYGQQKIKDLKLEG